MWVWEKASRSTWWDDTQTPNRKPLAEFQTSNNGCQVTPRIMKLFSSSQVRQQIKIQVEFQWNKSEQDSIEKHVLYISIQRHNYAMVVFLLRLNHSLLTYPHYSPVCYFPIYSPCTSFSSLDECINCHQAVTMLFLPQPVLVFYQITHAPNRVLKKWHPQLF